MGGLDNETMSKAFFWGELRYWTCTSMILCRYCRMPVSEVGLSEWVDWGGGVGEVDVVPVV